VIWIGGNVSGRDPDTGLVCVKSNGVLFPGLTAENMTVVDLDGNIMEARHGPYFDTYSHLAMQIG